MKVFTQEDFDNFEVLDGIKQCPSGDYRLIKTFAERCSFAKWCSFAEGCSFAKWCSFAEECSFANKTLKRGFPYLAIDGAGSENRKTYFFNTEQGIYVQSGCFFGTIEEFRIKVIQDNDEKKAKVYLGFSDLVEIQFGE